MAKMHRIDDRTSNRQERLYNGIHDRYAAHYYDPTSLEYRREFLLAPFIEKFGIDLNGKTIADLCCGDGYSTALLRRMVVNSQFVGFDISGEACKHYPLVAGAEAHHLDLTKSIPHSFRSAFDAAIIFGGLHHMIFNLRAAVANAATMIRPGGHLLMMEPNRRYALQGLRRLWYRLDSSFDHQTEGAIDHDKLYGMSSDLFDLVGVKYFGGPAFFLILNSMIFRIPLSWKPAIAKVALPLERGYNAIPFRLAHASFLAAWRLRI